MNESQLPGNYVPNCVSAFQSSLSSQLSLTPYGRRIEVCAAQDS
jgi:hypothetical protein